MRTELIDNEINLVMGGTVKREKQEDGSYKYIVIDIRTGARFEFRNPEEAFKADRIING